MRLEFEAKPMTLERVFPVKSCSMLRWALIVFALTQTLLVSACNRPYRNLPSDLKVIVDQNPLSRKIGMLHPLQRLEELQEAREVAALKDDIYAIFREGNSTPVKWRPAGQKEWKPVDGGQHFKVLATDEDSQVIYAAGDDGVFRLYRGETSWQPVGDRIDQLKNVQELAVSPISKAVFAKTRDARTEGRIFYLKEGENKWQSFDGELANIQPPILNARISNIRTIKLARGAVYAVAEYLDVNERSDSAVPEETLVQWDEKGGWKPYTANLPDLVGDPTVFIKDISMTGDGEIVLVTSYGATRNWRTDGQPWTTLSLDVSELLVDPNNNDVLYSVGVERLYWTPDRGKTWQLVGEQSQRYWVRSITYHRGWQVPLVATVSGVYFVTLPQRDPLEEASRSVRDFYKSEYKKSWLWIVHVLAVYFVGMIGLLLSAWRGGSTIFSRTSLISIAAKPLLLTPGLGRWALFIGYKRRLLKLSVVKDASKNYFGLPAEDSTGSLVLPDLTGELLHGTIAENLGPQRPVIITGKGGAGKSTLLARWAFLALKGQLPAPLKGFRPLLITAGYFNENLIQAIADTLRERDGVATDERMIKAQLESGKFLILFDGITELETDKQQSLEDILRTARNADFQGCRFLITTRRTDEVPSEVTAFHLKPLTSDVISVLLPRYKLGRERESQVRRQLQSFGEKPIEPLLFTMALEVNEVSYTRAKLYERYLRRLLRVDTNETLWSGWRTGLEAFAYWFLVSTGKRGVGLPHKALLDRIAGKGSEREPTENLVQELQRFFRLPVKDELDLIQQLEASGLLQRGRRWLFAHDTFEEYFAASYLVSYFAEREQWPFLDHWVGFEREHEFLDILDFVREMVDEPTRQQILELHIPSLWKDRLKPEIGYEADSNPVVSDTD